MDTGMEMQIETSRLVLRVPRLADLDAWAAMMTDEQTARFIGGVMPRAVTWRALMTMIGAWHAHRHRHVLGFEKSGGRWVGRLGPWQPEGWPGTEVGWAWRATAGAGAMPPKAPTPPRTWPSIARVDQHDSQYSPENVASQAVAIRLGSKNLGPGTLPPPFQESRIDIWGQSREKWRAGGANYRRS